MKRNRILAILCLICAFLLFGCGNSAAPADSPAPVQTAEPTETPVPSATLPDAELEPEDTEPTLFEIAKSFEEQPLEELIAAIGEPISSSYGPSCLIQGGQDGELKYDGFTVYTVTDGKTETVQGVLED